VCSELTLADFRLQHAVQLFIALQVCHIASYSNSVDQQRRASSSKEPVSVHVYAYWEVIFTFVHAQHNTSKNQSLLPLAQSQQQQLLLLLAHYYCCCYQPLL
jgi:hypothetical protein